MRLRLRLRLWRLLLLRLRLRLWLRLYLPFALAFSSLWFAGSQVVLRGPEVRGQLGQRPAGGGGANGGSGASEDMARCNSGEYCRCPGTSHGTGGVGEYCDRRSSGSGRGRGQGAHCGRM